MHKNAYGMNEEKEFSIERSTVMNIMKYDLKKEKRNEKLENANR